jgi:hypothetical protein
MEEYIITFTTIDNQTQTQLCETQEVFDFVWQSYDEREDKLSLSFETIQTTGSI